MRFPKPQESRMYGNPEDIVSAQQQQAINDKRKGRKTLHVKKGWSKERQAAEALFAPPKDE